MQEIETYAQKGVDILLIGNKQDLHEQRVVSFEEGQELSTLHNIPFLETSA